MVTLSEFLFYETFDYSMPIDVKIQMVRPIKSIQGTIKVELNPEINNPIEEK